MFSSPLLLFLLPLLLRRCLLLKPLFRILHILLLLLQRRLPHLRKLQILLSLNLSIQLLPNLGHLLVVRLLLRVPLLLQLEVFLQLLRGALGITFAQATGERLCLVAFPSEGMTIGTVRRHDFLAGHL